MQHRPLHHWGTTLWAFLHTITVIDFDEQKRMTDPIIECLRGIDKIIPCHKCAAHYREFFQTKIDGTQFERMELFYVFVDYHNVINQKLGKPIMSHAEAVLLWTKTM
jgi:hypothetical protein